MVFLWSLRRSKSLYLLATTAALSNCGSVCASVCYLSHNARPVIRTAFLRMRLNQIDTSRSGYSQCLRCLYSLTKKEETLQASKERKWLLFVHVYAFGQITGSCSVLASLGEQEVPWCACADTKAVAREDRYKSSSPPSQTSLVGSRRSPGDRISCEWWPEDYRGFIGGVSC